MHLRLIRGDIFERVGNNFVACLKVHALVCKQIAHFRAALSLSIKATPGALPFI